MRRLPSRLLGAAALAVALAAGPSQFASAGSFSFAPSMSAAAARHQVALPLVQAIAYVNSRWEVIPQASIDGGVGPMNIHPGQLDQAAALSGHSRAEIVGDPAANLDAGAALLAHQHAAGSDLVSWRPAVVDLLGEFAAAEVYADLRSGESRTNSLGETISFGPQPVPESAARSAASTPGAASADYPPAGWVAASTANFSTANRPRDYPVDMVIIHDTEGSYGSAIAEFQNPAAQSSAHYVVSDAGDITQMVREHDIAWHAGNWDYNTRAIGIEHEGYAYTPGYYTTAMYNASAGITASICSRYGVPMDRDHVIGHAEVPDPNNPGLFGGSGHHTDPGPYWNWSYYMDRAKSVAATLPSPPHLMPNPVAENTNVGTATVSWLAARSCHDPITGYHVVGQPGNLVQDLPASATSATFTGLQDAAPYTFTVTVSNPEGQDSATSNPVMFR